MQANLMLARYYSSSLGRFQNPDPRVDVQVRDPQSWNKYAYVRDNPLRFADPRGTERSALENSGVDGPGQINPEKCPANECSGSTGFGWSTTYRRKPGEGSAGGHAGRGEEEYGPGDPTNPSLPLYENPVVRDQANEAWARTNNGTARGGLAEAGFAIRYENGFVSVGPIIDSVHSSGPAEQLDIPVDEYTIAIYHTHGNNGVPTPSAGPMSDMTTRVPNFVRSRGALYVTVPGTGTYIQLKPVP